jgi:hypothetical protein
MLGPIVAAGRVEPDDFVRIPVDRRNVTALRPITEKAGPRQVFFGGPSTVFDGNNVVWFMRKQAIVFVDQAILAALFGSVADKLS